MTPTAVIDRHATPTVPALHAPSADPAAAFAALQRRLPAVHAAAQCGEERTHVVVPSRTIDKWHEPAAETQAYEERLLCSLLELQDPAVRMTYVTSSLVAPAIVDYCLSLLPPRMRSDARSRLSLLAVGERTSRSLSEKLLERPELLARIRRAIADPSRAQLVPYTTTPLERDVALALDIPMYGADPRHAEFGTKSGCRRLFARAGVPHPAGAEGLRGVTDAIAAIAELRRERITLSRLVMKLNDGVSGEGNAIIDLDGLPAPGSPGERAAIAERVGTLRPEAPGVTPAAFLARLTAGGGVVEEWIDAPELHSPSVQLQITPCGEVELLSTHDQILGGPSGQSYLGCRFPTAPAYASVLTEPARRVGEELARAGVVGRLAIDFVVARADSGAWQPFAIEINLRKGGTTHPFETLAALTGGHYDADRATFVTPLGEAKHYVATDHLEAPELRALGTAGLIALARRRDLRFHPLRRTGVVFHMLSSVDELGRCGFTAIANTAAEADALAARVTATVMAQAARAARAAHGEAIAACQRTTDRPGLTRRPQKTMTTRPRRPPASITSWAPAARSGGYSPATRSAMRPSEAKARSSSSQSVRSSASRTRTACTAMPRSASRSSQPRTTAIPPPSRTAGRPSCRSSAVS